MCNDERRCDNRISGNVSSGSDSKLAFSPKYSNKEIELMVTELHDLRIQNKELLDLCLPDKFKTAWEYGY